MKSTLKGLIDFLEYLCDHASHLSETKLNKERVTALRLIVRGWKVLAGESDEDAEKVADEIGAGTSVLLANLKNNGGRPLGARTKDYVEKDRMVLADIAKGATYKKAIKNHYKGDNHLTRIKRMMKEHKRLIALQSEK